MYRRNNDQPEQIIQEGQNLISHVFQEPIPDSSSSDGLSSQQYGQQAANNWGGRDASRQNRFYDEEAED